MSYVAYNSTTGNAILDSIVWGGYWDLSTSFGGPAGFVTYSIDNGFWSGEGFLDYEIVAINAALEAWSNVCGLQFLEVDPGNPTDSEYWENITFVSVSNQTMTILAGDGVLGFHDTPGDETTLFNFFGIPSLQFAPLAGVYNYEGWGWTEEGLLPGGYGFITLIHELGHGLGFAHPHDSGGISTILEGVSQSFGDYGVYDLNQGIFTTMSYNDGWSEAYPYHSAISYGYQSTPMAFDIYLAQLLYGENRDHNVGNNIYDLAQVNASGTSWACIWDAGGIDTISNEGSNLVCSIDLRAAPLVGGHAGGYVSYAAGIVGGFTIAHNVVIENANGGNGADQIVGNDASNKLYGDSGNDVLYGGNNKDKLYGGSGNDRSYGEAGNDRLYMDAGNDTLDGGSGTDWLYVTGSTNSVVNLARTSAQNTGYGTDIIKNIENASGGTGVDKFYGTTGNNTLKGNNGNDILHGKNGNDVLYGGNNNDKLYGGAGNDTLKGDAGRDRLQGDAGKDILFGGADADTFVFRRTSDSSATASKADVIIDFARGDKIDLSAIDASTKLTGNNAFTFDGTKAFGTSKDGDIYYKKFNNAGTANDYTMVFIDTDNDRGTEMSIKLMGLYNLTASDFIL